MGVRHPRDAVVTPGVAAPGAAAPSNSALVQAVSAYRAALAAAAEHAAVDAAVRRIDAKWRAPGGGSGRSRTATSPGCARPSPRWS